MATAAPQTPTKKRTKAPDASALVPASKSLPVLAEAAASCRACRLWKDTTQTVFGEGPRKARILLVGEQPGDVEDREGHVFVGPAGRVLDECLEAAGIARSDVYLTNAVKHFAHERKGKKRLHQRPTDDDARICRPWLEAELRAVQPEIVVALGVVAATSLHRKKVTLTALRGDVRESALAPRTLVTFHPSAVLRQRSVDPEAAARTRQMLIDDLRMALESLAPH
jgi:DNA polymerase